MRRLQLALGLLPITCAAVLAGACNDGVSGVGLVLRAPQGLLDEVTSMKLSVFPAEGLTCDTATGLVSGSASSSDEFDLDRGGCESGATWCKTITLAQDDSEKVFQIIGSAAGEARAQGCAVAVIDQDPLEVSIQAFAVNPPKCCNNGQLEAGEQCDTPGAAATVDCAGAPGAECIGITADAVCTCDCLAQEILLSSTNMGVQPLIENLPNTKAELSLAFAGPAGNGEVANSLRAVYTDLDPATTSGPGDITSRMMRGNLYPPSAGSTFARQLRLPRCDNFFLPNHLARVQRQPDVARVSDTVMGAVFASDVSSPNVFDILVSAQGPDGCADVAVTPGSDQIQLNATTGTSCEWPAIAGGPNGTSLVVWNQGGALRGRIWDATDVVMADLTPANNDIDIGAISGGTRPRVAGSADGWVVAYAASGAGDGDGVFYKTVDLTANVGPEVKVNTLTDGLQDQPDVAMLPDGRFVVVWNSAGTIYFQRYAADGTANATDQDAPLSQNSPPGGVPAVASGGTIDTFYFAAWATTDGTVWSRIIDGESGFRRNSVTGQVDDYLASHPNIAGARVSPDVAVGGDGFVALGWLDTDMAHYGMFVRRFPLPLR